MTVSGVQASFSILAVDDNELNLSLFKLFLSQLGHNVRAVNDPFEALNLATQETFDLIFTDFQMPGITGIEAASKFRENGFGGPIIAITAHLSESERNSILASKLDDVLIKPVTKPELIRILNQYMGSDMDHESEAAKEIRTDHPQYVVSNPVLSSNRKLYDIELALGRANGSATLATELLELLLENLRESLTELANKNTTDEVRTVLHKISGGLHFTGAANLESYLQKLLSQSDALSEKEEVQREVENLIEWIEQNPNPFYPSEA